MCHKQEWFIELMSKLYNIAKNTVILIIIFFI